MDMLHLQRFRREARVAARLHHTNIVPVFGVGEQDGVHYYAMQFIDGESLQAPCFQPRGFSTIAQWGLQIAEALAYAHGQGVLHRDVKPSNLLLDRAGNIWLTDFGLAKAEVLPDLTRAGDVVGTLRYMAPEQLDGAADGRSDVYSLGLVLYELLTGRPAFDAADRNQLVKQVTQEEPPPPRRLGRRAPRDLDTIVVKAIAKEPARRYSTALARLFWSTKRPKEAEEAYGQALPLLEKLVADQPTVRSFRSDLANNLNHLAVLLQTTGRPDEAAAAYRRALALQERLAAELTSTPAYQHDLAGTLNNLAKLLTARGDPAEARRLLERAI